MQINFTGNKPEKKTYAYSVKQNNNSNIIIFILDKIQEELDLSSLSCFVKVQGSEIDKDVPNVEVVEDKIHVNWTLLRKHTESRMLSVQLQFEGQNDVVWQSEILQLVLSDTIKADEYIENKYPAVLVDHEGRLQNHEARVTNAENQLVVQEAEITALDEKIAQALAGVFHYKGSVATYNDLPTENQEVGDTYNILDTGDNYTWNGSEWDKLSGIVDLTQYYTSEETDILLDEKADKEELAYYVDLESDQTITGVKTFSNETKFGNFGLYPADKNEIRLRKATSDFLRIQNNLIMPYGDNILDLGNGTHRYKDLYLGGTLKLGTRKISEDIGYFVVRNTQDTNNIFLIGDSQAFTRKLLPIGNNADDIGSTSNKYKDGHFSGQVYAQNTFNVINAEDIVNNTLTQAQYDLITNGKPTRIIGTIRLMSINFVDLFILPLKEFNNLVYSGECSGRSNTDWTYHFTFSVNIGTKVIAGTTFKNSTDYTGRTSIDKLVIASKEFPTYPTDNTKNYTLKLVAGVLTWVEDN